MIKINLLRERSAKKPSWMSQQSSASMLSVLVLLVVLLGLGLYYRSLTSQRQTLQTQLTQLRQESVKLQEAKSQLERFERQKKLLTDRIAVIQTLKNKQQGPVQMMNSIVSSIPAAAKLWLTNLSQKDNVITLEGQAQDVPSIADFIASLGGTPSFSQVDLGYWEENEKKDRIQFELTCVLTQ